MPDAPSHAGPYRLVSHIASGGMGLVYLGEREDGREPTRAAVKLLRRGIDEDQTRRFAAEREILATLQHPNIARLIDAGVTEDHRPYLVMEYVSGLPIDRYCDNHRLAIRHRVALLRSVARAVAHAHQNLVVHRDLKPSNIFVTHIGVVKLLDFGIAKLVELDPDRTTQMTGPGLRLMTPSYASPEQVTGGFVTTATDVYVLGLLLFELLTGLRAQEADGLSIPEVERIVVGTEVPRPSDAVDGRAAAAADPAARAESRATTPSRLRRQLRGDLDRIVGVATRKDPARRYPSADALAADLDRYLAGQPIQARDESRADRIGTFVRRRWPVVAAAAVFLVLLATYAVTVTIQARQVEVERDRARAAQDVAEGVTTYLVRMFQASDPSETRGDTITAKELLATGVAHADTLAAHPATQAQLLDVIGRVYQSLGRFDEALPPIERALATRRRLYGPDHVLVGDSLTHLGDLLILRGRYQEAEAAARQALAIHERASGRGSAAAAEDLGLIGASLASQGERVQSKALLDEALTLRRRAAEARRPGHRREPERARLRGLGHRRLRPDGDALRRGVGDPATGVRREASAAGARPEQPGRGVRHPGPLRRRLSPAQGSARDAAAAVRRHASGRGHQPEQPEHGPAEAGAVRRGRAAGARSGGAAPPAARQRPSEHDQRPQQSRRAAHAIGAGTGSGAGAAGRGRGGDAAPAGGSSDDALRADVAGGGAGAAGQGRRGRRPPHARARHPR